MFRLNLKAFHSLSANINNLSSYTFRLELKAEQQTMAKDSHCEVQFFE